MNQFAQELEDLKRRLGAQGPGLQPSE
jgi:hypothetical protein